MELLKAFLVGGAICGCVQILMDATKLLPGRIMVLLVCIGSIISAIGIYPDFAEWAGAGATVPLAGFGNMLFQGVKKAVDTDGFIGVFRGGLSETAVGISGALIFGYVAAILFSPKMKKES